MSFEIERNVIVNYNEEPNTTDVVIPKGTRKIGNNAFQDCTKITSVTIPESVIYIGTNAFLNCKSLERVIFEGNNIKKNASIGWNFKNVNCFNFEPSEKLRFLNLGHSVFKDCENLKEINLPRGITDLWDNLFSGCKNLTEITIPDTVENIGKNVFYNTGLIDIEIPDSVTRIGESAFYNTNLVSLTIPEDVKYVGPEAFANSKLERVEILGETYLNERAFLDCFNLTTINAPKTMSIGKDVFKNTLFESIQPSVYLVVGSGKKQFIYKFITTQDGSTYVLGNDILYQYDNTTNLTDFEFPDDFKNNHKYIKNYDCMFFISNDGVLLGYNGTSANLIIPSMVKVINPRCFQNHQEIKSVTIPESVESIGGYAFADCYNIMCANIPDSVKTLGCAIFKDCTNIVDINLPTNVNKVDIKFKTQEGTFFRKVTIKEINKILNSQFNGYKKSVEIQQILKEVIFGYSKNPNVLNLQ